MPTFEARRDLIFPGSWRVEPADYHIHGKGFIAIFTGENAKHNAIRYAERKNLECLFPPSKNKIATPQEKHTCARSQ